MTLFMVEIRVADWPGTLAWYTEVLGLRLLLHDEPRRFALLDAGAGKVALKGQEEPNSGRAAVRLTFQVEDVEAERRRLRARGEAVSAVLTNTREGYREVRLRDPEGTPICLFAWV